MTSKPNQKTINVALQGGGAHGAFAWGVLDKLLEDGRLTIEGLCGTSAGTMNACALAYGMHLGGNEKAREVLHDLWHNVHLNRAIPNPWTNTPFGQMADAFPMAKLVNVSMYHLMEAVTRFYSPSQLNPLKLNPLRAVLEKTIDFDELQRCDCLKLFISTTHVGSGKVRIFEQQKVSIDVALASACLPFLFEAVEIDGEHYWDGGYVGNPALWPLFYKTDTRDLLVVHINPINRDTVPTTAGEIDNRINEISFNSSLLSELRAIAFVKKLIEHDMLKDDYQKRFKDVLVHAIRADEAMCNLSVPSKFQTDWSFLTDLRDRGRSAMTEWLDENYKHVNKKDSIDLHEEFLHTVSDMFSDKKAE